MNPPHSLRGEEWRDLTISGHPANPQADSETLARAEEGIRRYRQRDVALRLVNRDGSPVRGLAVEVEQTRHAFAFGDQLWPLDQMVRFHEQDGDQAVYWRARFASLLNAATALCYWTEAPRNDGPKLEDFQGRLVTEPFAYCVDWAAAQGMVVKGHPLFWSIDKCVPDWVKRYDYDTQMKFAEVRVRNLVARFRGKVRIWDAVNEAMWEPAFRNLAQRSWPHIEPIAAVADYVEPVLRWCRDEDPDAVFLLNDYGMEEDYVDGAPRTQDGLAVTAALQRQRYLELVTELFRRGAPPSAIGLQSHQGKGWVSASRQMAVFDEMAQAGLPLHVTEFWAETSHLEASGRYHPAKIDDLQAGYVADILTCAFGHPAVEAFFFWGLMKAAVRWGEHSSHRLTPVYERVHDLLHNQWRTRLRLESDAGGGLQMRAFYGDYALRYRLPGGMTHGVPFTVDRQQAGPQTICLPFV